MFKPRKKEFRKRTVGRVSGGSSEDDGNASDASVGISPPTSSAPASSNPGSNESGGDLSSATSGSKPKKMRKKIKTKGDKGIKPVLSFGHEDEDENDGGGLGTGGDGVFKVKKSSASKAMSRATKEKSREQRAPAGTAPSSQKRPASSAPAGSSWHTATAGMYTAEGLAALRNSQAFTPKPSSGASERRRRVDRTRGEGTAGGVSDVGDAAGTGVGSAEGEQRVFAGDEAEIVHEAGEKGALSEEALDERHISRLKGQREARVAAAAASAAASRDGLDAGGGGDEDFIPLDGKVAVSGGGDDAAAGGLSAQNGEADDEEQQRWEAEQVRRGATRPAPEGEKKGTLSSSSPSSWGENLTLTTNGGGVTGPGSGVAERPRFLGVEELQKILRETGSQLRENHERNERQLQMIVSELEGQAATSEKLEKDQARAAERFAFFQRTQNVLSDLCGMLREKEEMLSEVEKATSLLCSRRLGARLATRTRDQEDEILDAIDAGAVIANLGPYRPSDASLLSGTRERVNNGSVAGKEREARREKRQKRRRRSAGSTSGGAAATAGARNRWGRDDEGWVEAASFPWDKKERVEIREALLSGGEESEGEDERARGRMGKVLEAVDMVMEDVDEEVKSVSAVKKLFEDWKRHHPDEYAQAYCTLTIPDLFAPFARLELLRWDPLSGAVLEAGQKGASTDSTAATQASRAHDAGEPEEDTEVLERFEWYRTLFDFSAEIPPPKGAGYGEAEDPDQNLVPQLVEKVAVPLLVDRLSKAYDAMSGQQTLCMTAAVGELLPYDLGEDALRKLLGAALTALQSAVRRVCVPVVGPGPASSGSEDADQRAKQVRQAAEFSVPLVRRQACRALKLLRNCLEWRRLLSSQSLVPLALGDLLGKRLVPALQGLIALRRVAGAGSAGASGGFRWAGGAGKHSESWRVTDEALALFERAVELLPPEWMDNPDAAAALASLRVVARLFGDGLPVGTGLSVGGSHGKAGRGAEKGKSGVERVVRLQVALGDEGGAQKLAQKHGLGIA